MRGIKGRRHVELLRESSEATGEVRPIELFFDLVYVLAVTQLSHHLLGDLTARGALETLILP
jgi:low temperature requirement protein LtrA